MSERLDQLAAEWSAWAVPLLWQFTLLAAALLLVDRFFLRRTWPRLRLALHGVVLLGLVLPPLLPRGFSIGLSIGLPQATSLSSLAATQSQDAARLAPSAGTTALTLAFTLWLAIALLLAAGVLFRHGRARARVRSEDLGASPALCARVASLARRLRLRRVPEVVVLPTASSPAVLGCWRPLLLLPAALAQRADAENGAEGETPKESEELEHVLLHELLHVKRCDLVAAFLSRFIAIAWWFHPLAWIVARRATALRELACDDDVARLLRERAPAYRATLLERARQLLAEPALPRFPGALGFFAMPSTLLARIEWLARPRRARPRLERAVTWLVAGVLLLAVLPAARADRGDRGPRAQRAERESCAPPTPLASESALRQSAYDIVQAALRGERPPGCLRLRNAVTLLSRNQS